MQGPRARVGAWVESRAVQRVIVTLILINAVILGLETSSTAMAAAGPALIAADRAILGVFVLEILLKLYAHRLGFFRNPWNVFDFAVVGIALIPSSGPLTVLRVLRVLRLVSMVPRFRFVVEALLRAIPGILSIVGLLAILYYVFAVMATGLFGERFPEWFGTIGNSMYTLFQIMTLESWSMGIVRPVMEAYPYAWVFFIPFILVATFTILNLFIAIIVSAMQSMSESQHSESRQEIEGVVHDEHGALRAELSALRQEIAELRRELNR
jgi:voltage-gated sodium channel